MYTFFDTTTKQVLRNTECPPEEADANLQPGEVYLEGRYSYSHYLDDSDPDNPVIADKIIVPHTVTDNLISDLPGDELQVEVSGPITDRFTIPAGETELEFTADVPGQYTLTLSGVKYLPTEIDLAI